MKDTKEVIEQSELLCTQFKDKLKISKENPALAVDMLESFINFVSKVESLDNKQINEHDNQ